MFSVPRLLGGGSSGFSYLSEGTLAILDLGFLPSGRRVTLIHIQESYSVKLMLNFFVGSGGGRTCRVGPWVFPGLSALQFLLGLGCSTSFEAI